MYKLNIGTSMQYHNNVTKQIHNIVTHIYEEAKNMNTHNKHERCLQGGSRIIYSHISKQRNTEIHTIIKKKNLKIKMKCRYLATSQNAMFR